MQDYHQLEIWNRAMDYVVAIYEFVGGLPEQEKQSVITTSACGDLGSIEHRGGMRCRQ
jgi:hypothetical protein